jgi:transposase
LKKCRFRIYAKKNIIKKAYKANPLLKRTGKRGRPQKSKALCLIERLDNHTEEILRFMKERDVPFDNNLAEHDLRMVKSQTENIRNISKSR